MIAYAALLAAAALTLRLALILYRRFPLLALRHYLVSLTGFFAAGFLRIVGNYTLQELLFGQGPPPRIHAVAAWVFGLLALPFFILALHAFVSMVLAMKRGRFAAPARAAFLALQGVMFAAYFAAGRPLGSIPESPGADAFQLTFSLAFLADVALLVVLLLLLATAWAGKAIADLRPFSLLYAVLLALGLAGPFLMASGPLLRVVDPAATFLIHLPPLLLLRRAMAGSARAATPAAESLDRLAALLSRQGISKREAEIVQLLLQGKSYRAIEDELFISLKTVKTHVYNSYRKLGVRSRWQLLNLVQGLPGGTGPSRPV